MPAEIQLDEITRSTFEADSRGIRYLQHGVAKGIPETDPAKLLARLPDLSGVSPTGTAVQIPRLGTKHLVYPRRNGVTRARTQQPANFERIFGRE